MKTINIKSWSCRALNLISMTLLTVAPGLPANAQNPAIPVPAAEATGLTMSIFPVGRGPDGQQFITTKAGFKVTVPGLGIAPDANEIAVYRNAENQFWYVDKNGATQPVSATQLQWTMAQINHQQAMRNIEIEKTSGMTPEMVRPGMVQTGMAQPMMQPGMMQPGMIAAPTSTVIVQNQQPSNMAGTAMVSGLAAATGAMAGSAISNSMYDHNNGYCGIPYGAACYHANGHYYYNAENGAHEIASTEHNPYMDQWNRQEAYQNNSQDRHNAYNNLNGNQQQMLKNEGALKMEDREEHPAERMGGLGGLGGLRDRFRR